MRTTLQTITVFFLGLCFYVSGQEQPKQNNQVDDTIRITTELVQTGVIVLDKQGHFVDGLKPEQFELRVDGKPQPISFFERVVTGSAQEEKAQLAARTGATTSSIVTPTGATLGRTIIFFIDDFHLSASGVDKVRKSILHFIDNEMAWNDQVLVASATGQIGFVSQLTDNKAVLRAAVGRLNYRQYAARDGESIPMTEYQAIKISQGDRDAIGYYVTQLQQATTYRPAGGGLGPPAGGVGVVGQRVTQGSSGPASPANIRYEAQVKRRAENIISQSMAITANTLKSLENLTREATQLAGSKLVFFLSDGFFLIDNKSGAGYHLQEITDAAARAGVVIYSMDARGMTNFTDASSNRSDPAGQLSRANIGELSVSQDPLAALASNTGGRALFNTDNLNSAVANALKETSNYYLLAWRPAGEEPHGGKFKNLEVSVVGRSDLTIRLPRGYLDSQAEAAQQRAIAKEKKQEEPAKTGPVASPAETEMRSALLAWGPRRGLGALLSTSFIDTPNNGAIVITSTQIETSGLGYGAESNQPASVELRGVVLNDTGKPVDGFKSTMTIKPGSPTPSQTVSDGAIYTYRASLSPGLYQIRVAARDDKSGKIGSAMQWIEIPDLKAHRLTLSSILLGGHEATGKSGGVDAGAQMEFSVDRLFKRASKMSILAFVYNAARGTNGALDVSGQIQVFRDGKAVISSPQRKIPTDGLEDPSRIPFGGDLNLSSLTPGRYALQITITDSAAQTTATQRIGFEVQ